MSYTKTTWVNDAAPAINAENLNKIEQGIYDATETADAAEVPSNKVSAFQSTPDNTHYPSEKLVYDNLALKADKTSLAVTNRSLDALWALSEGQVWDFDTDTAEVYSADVPTGAKYDNVTMIGGKSIVWNQLVDSSTSSVTLTSGHKYFTDISGTESIETGAGSAVSVTGGTDMVIDLTQMLGSGNEPTTVAEFKAMFPLDYYAFSAGEIKSASVNTVEAVGFNQWDEEWELGSFYISTGVKYDDSTRIRSKNRIEIFSSTSYYLNQPSNATTLVCYWDSNGTYLGYVNITGKVTFTTLANACYMAISPGAMYGATYNNDICINKSVTDTTKPLHNGIYAPYLHSTHTIPSAIQSLTGYGWSAGSVYNYVDYAEKKYHQRVARVDLGTLNWQYASGTPSYFYADMPSDSASSRLSGIGAISAMYSIYTGYIVNFPNLSEIVCNTTLSSQKKTAIRNDSYTDAATFKTAMSGVYLYYELATEVVTDISDLLDEGFMEKIPVEAGGTVTFKNTNGDSYKTPITNTNEFIVKLDEVS